MYYTQRQAERKEGSGSGEQSLLSTLLLLFKIIFNSCLTSVCNRRVMTELPQMVIITKIVKQRKSLT